jgi:hypothetical protein
MAARLGLGVLPSVGWSAREVQTIARQAAEAGFDAICAAEAPNDVLATVPLMGTATTRRTVATWSANISLRHPYVCAPGAACLADATGGRFLSDSGAAISPSTRPGASTCPSRRPRCGAMFPPCAAGSGGQGQPPLSRSDQRPLLCRSLSQR